MISAALFSDTIADVDVYNFSSGEWSIHAEPLPIETAAGGAGVLHNKIHYVGGETGQLEAFSQMQIFTPEFDEWTLGAPLNRARHGTNCCVYNGKLWIAARSGARGGTPELTSIEAILLES